MSYCMLSHILINIITKCQISIAFFSPLLEKGHFFLFYVCDVRQLISFSTHCVSLCQPQISILSVDVSLNFHVSCSLLLFCLLCLIASFFPPLCIHRCLYISIFCLSFPFIFLPCLFLAFLFLSSFVSLSVFAFFLHWHNILSLSLYFPFVSHYLPDSLQADPRSILVVYLPSLKPWRWIIEQTDPWLHSCCLGVVCLFFWFHFSSLSASGFVCLSVFLNNLGVPAVVVPCVCAHFCAVFVC